MKCRWGAICLVFCISPLFGQESRIIQEKGEKILISWEAALSTYHVAIRKEGEIFYTLDTEINELWIDLAPGIYEYQIAFIDPFGGTISKTDWNKLEILHDSPPYFRVIKPINAWADDGETKLEIDSAVLKPGVTFLLIQGDQEMPITGTTQGRITQFTIDTRTLSTGAWGLLCTSQTGKTFLVNEAFTIREKPILQLDQMSTLEFMNTDRATVRINGANFDKSMWIDIEGPSGKIQVVNIEINDSNEAWITLNTETAQPGNYSLTITNTADQMASQEDVIIIREKITEDEDAEEMPSAKQQRFKVSSGFSPMVTLFTEESSTLINPSFLGIELTAILNSGSGQPFLRALGIGLQGTLNVNGPNQVYGPFDMTGAINVLAYWQPLLKSSIRPLIELGIGSMWMNFITNESSSNKLYFRLGLAVEFLKVRTFYHIGVSLMASFGENNIIPAIGLIFRRGLRL